MNYTTYSAQYGANGTTTGKQQNKPKGNYIETLAAEHLKREGYEILARNYAYRGGELDIVAREGETIVFVEVKSVWNNQQGNPAARVNAKKQYKIWQTACHFLYTRKDVAPKRIRSALPLRCLEHESLPSTIAVRTLQKRIRMLASHPEVLGANPRVFTIFLLHFRHAI
jgi:Predicted endonuclease distantly related to archaeal Holliday junction resolvase